MISPRQYDQSSFPTPLRSDRLFSDHSLWYFKTREGDDVGPFRYRNEAESGLKLFIDKCKERLVHCA